MKLQGKTLFGNFLRFIIPSILAQWVFTLYTIVDGIFVAKGVSEVALTAVNISMPFTTALFSISILFAVGNSTVVAILLGRKKGEEASEAFSQNLFFLGILSIVLSVIVMLNLENFANFLGATDLTREYVCQYVGTIAPFAIAFVFSYSFEMLIKTDGYPKKAMTIVLTGAILNVILDYLFVLIFKWGVFGASFATGLSQTVVCILYIFHFLSKKGVLRFVRFKWKTSLIIREARNGIASGLVEFSSGFYIFLFNQVILFYLNENALVSFTIIAYVNSLVVMSMAGIAQGCQPLISYYYGQNNWKNCKKLLRYCLMATGIMALAFFGTYFIGTRQIVYLFVSKTNHSLMESSVVLFRIFNFSYLIVGFNIVIGGFFTSIEKPIQAIAISFMRGFLVVALCLFTLTQIFGGWGIWWAPMVSETICLISSIILLRKALTNKS